MSETAHDAGTPPDMTADEPAPAGASTKPTGARRLLQIVVAILVFLVLPALVIGVFVGEFGVAAMFVGLLLGVTGSKLGGTHRMLYVAPAIGVAGAIGAYTAYDWWWVALLATAAVITGAGIGFGWFAALLMIPYAATFVTPVDTVTDAAIYGVILAIATLYGVVVARRFGAPEIAPGDRLPLPVAAAVAITFGVVLGVSAAIGVGLGWTEPYWVPEPVLVLVLYVLLGRGERIRGKAIGTAVGIAAALLVALVSPSTAVVTVLGAIAFVLALTQRKTYWLMYGLYTFALVLLLSAPSGVGYEAEERGVEILVGVGLLVVGLAVVHAFSNRMAKRYPQPELAPG